MFPLPRLRAATMAAILALAAAAQGFAQTVEFGPVPKTLAVPGEVVVLLNPSTSLQSVLGSSKSLVQTRAQQPVRPAPTIEKRIASVKEKISSAQSALRSGQTTVELTGLRGQLRQLETLQLKLRTRQARSITPPSPTELFDRLWVLQVPEDQVEATIQRLQAMPGVVYAGRNEVAREERVVNDPMMPPFRTAGAAADFLYGLQSIEAPAAWDLSIGRPDIVVAVNETGFDIQHPDLAANVWRNELEIAGNGIDDDGNGYIDDRNGIRFSSSSPGGYTVVIPPDYHGTHVAGTIAASGDNGVGVAGIAFGSRVMAAEGDTLIERTNAILYAVDQGADVINNSWSTSAVVPYLYAALEYAHSRGTVVIASASNDNSHAYAKLPAAATQVITVAAHDHLDRKASFSNYGPKIDVTAPGVQIGSTLPQGTYGALNGTSMSGPHVAGVAALILSRNLDLHEADPVNHPLLTVEQVRQILRRSADDVVQNPNGGPALDGFDVYSGYGRINARRALELTAQPREVLEVKILGPQVNYTTYQWQTGFSGGWALVSGTFNLSGIVNGEALDHYVVEEGDGAIPDTWRWVAQSSTPVTGAPGQDVILANLNADDFSNGLHTFRIRAVSSSGQVYEDRHLIFIQRALMTNFAETWENPNPPFVFWPLDLVGSASSPHFSQYRLEYGLGANPAQWTPFGSVKTAPVPQAGFYLFQQLDLSEVPDGVVTLRLAVDDTVLGPSEHSLVIRNDGTNFPNSPGFPNTDGWLVTNHSTPVVADLSGDGTKEVIVSRIRGLATINSDGSMTSTSSQFVDWEMSSVAAVGNLDSDPEQEVAIRGYRVATGHEGIFVFNHDMTPVSSWPGWIQSYGTLEAAYRYYTSNSVVLHDFDADGIDELIFTSAGDASHSVHVLKADGSPVAGWSGGLATSAASAYTPAVGDLDGDGAVEIVVADLGGTLYAFSQSGVLRWQLGLGNNQNRQLVLADIDGNGAAEVIVNLGGALQIIGGTGSVIRNIAVPGFGQGRFALGDLNGDGDIDAVTNSSSQVNGQTVYWVSAHTLINGTTLAGWPYQQAENPTPGYKVISDLDGDGVKEILIGTFSGTEIFGYRANGTRIQESEDPRYPLRKKGTLITSPVLADLNGDGHTEVLYDPSGWSLTSLQIPGTLAADGSDWTAPYVDQKNSGHYKAALQQTPDLVIDSIQLGPDHRAVVTFSNRGSAPVTENAVITITMRSGATVVYSQTISLASLPSQAYRNPGGSGSATQAIIMNYAIRDIDAYVDATNLVAEEDETNNQMTVRLKALPDLTVRALRVLPGSIIEADIENLGNDTVPSYVSTVLLRVQVSGTSLTTSVNLKTLPNQSYAAVGGVTTVQFSAWPLPAGVQTIVATVDSGGNLVELSDNNNERSLTGDWGSAAP